MFATPPISPYTIADNIVDPSCAPNTLHCYVSVVTADNGITATGSNIQLGGTLTNPGFYTTIDGAGYTQGLEISGLDTAYFEANKDFFLQSNDRVVIRKASGSSVEVGTNINLNVGSSGALLISGNAGTTGQVLVSGGPGVAPAWQTLSGGGSSLPTQTGNAGKYLTTDGTTASWTTIAGGGILSIGTINSLTRSANGAGISGNSLVLQTGDGINPGLLIGETSASKVRLGTNAGLNATSSTDNVFIGINAGQEAASITDEVYIGHWAGYQSNNSWNNNYMGRCAGCYGSHNIAANFFGNSAGSSSSYSGSSNFFGNGAGEQAQNATFSTFIGNMAGLSSHGAANSIFIGTSAGYGDNLTNYLSADSNVAPITYSDTSILIGHRTSTGNFKNSIAIGAYATNTAENQFMIGSTIRPIDATRINGSSSTQCTITTGTGIACTSDERLKTNITDLHTDTLDKVVSLKTVTYNWLQNPDSPKQVGFLAQDLEQYFPELVATDKEGMKSVYYAQMTPILVEAIRELNVKVSLLSPGGPSVTVYDGIKTWLGDAQNGIAEIIADTLRARNQICIDDVCMTKDQLRTILQNNATVISTPTPGPVITTPTELPQPDPVTASSEQTETTPTTP